MRLSDRFTPMGFILTRDRPRAKAFYSDVLEFRLMTEDDFGAVFDMAGLTVRLTDIADHQPSPHTVMGWRVPDLTAAVQALQARGVAMLIYPGFGQDADGIWSAPDGRTRIVWFNDPDGNNLSLTEGD